MPDLNYLSLKVFAEILRSGSFEAAARKLHITPSAVSQRIRQLEDQLGQLLIIRGSPSRATASGEMLYLHAQQIQAMEADFFSQLQQNSSNKIAVAVNMDSMDGWFLDAMTEATRLGIMLNLQAEDQQFSETLLREGKVMAAVSTHSKPIQGCSTERLGTLCYSAYASVAFCEQYLPHGELAENFVASPAISFNEKDGLQHAFLKLVTGRDVEPTTMFIPSNTAYVEAIQRGLGWGMLPDFISERSLERGNLVKLFPESIITTDLYWIRWNTKIAALDRLTECVRRAAKIHLKTAS